MKINRKTNIYTHEGGVAKRISSEQELRRSVLSCLLWEDTFYEDGISIADRIFKLCRAVSPKFIADLAVEARVKYGLRHAPIWLTIGLLHAHGGKYVRDVVYNIVQRPDELPEILAMYWMDSRKPIANSLKKGLAKAFTKFDAYQLAKYDRDGKVTLRDVMFLCHPKPLNKEQEAVWKELVNMTLKPPDTWEVALSAGADKKETFERLMREGKLGTLAFLRNLRNMIESGIDISIIKEYMNK